jgi:CO/xanthine dehydrogenase Mo-binding subunit
MADAPKSVPTLPGSLQANPILSQWIRFDRSGTVSISSGKVEIGQGILTSLAQIAAEELDVAPARIRMEQANTTASPNEGVTSGSLSIQDSGVAIRHVCAEARALLLAEAAAEFGVGIDKLTVDNGMIRIAGRATTTSYWALATPALLARRATAQVAPKSPSQYKIVGTSAERLDLPDKVLGRPRYVHDLTPPGMLFGRVVRPPRRRATLESVDETRARALGVFAIVRDGGFLGVITEREEIAVKAAQRLAEDARWSGGIELPDEQHIEHFLRGAPVDTKLVHEVAAAAAPGEGQIVRATYNKPFIAHASIGPSCAIAQWQKNAQGEDTLVVDSHTQSIYNLRADLGKALRMPEARITVRHVEGAGCYGHNPADDVALDAALLARAAHGRPVQAAWTREQELGWAAFGSAMVIDLQARLDAQGQVVDWQHDVWSNGHSSRPGRDPRPTLLSAGYLAEPFEIPVAIDMPPPNGGSERNAQPGYAFPRQRVMKHRALDMPIRTSAMRSLGGFGNVFAIESFMDELAAAAKADPVEFRLRHLTDARARAVLEAAAQRANWHGFERAEGRGHGIAWARYKTIAAWGAVVAEVVLEKEVRVARLVCAVDVGLVINPDGVINQVEGGAIQGASWALKEAVRFDRERVTSDSWESYPILAFSEVPEVVVEIVNRPETPTFGAGEVVQGPVGAAIANAVYDALGVRVRSLPLTAERIRAALA